MPQLKFNDGKVEDFTIVLCTRDYRRLGQLTGIKGVHYTCHDNSPNEISFSVIKHDENTLWEKIEDFKIIWVKETDEYFEIKVSVTDSLEVSKTITGTPIPEAELSQILLSIEVNTEDDIALNKNATTFYNEAEPGLSLLHRVLSRATGYTIKYVDDSLKNLQRNFSVSDSTIYDFLVGECSEQFHCIFKFDSSDRTIRVYDLKHYGKDTTIYVDKSNLTDSISLEVNTDNVKNCFKLVAGDESITAAVRMLNPNGSDYIYHIPGYLKKDMPAELVAKLETYDDLYRHNVENCERLTGEIYKLHDDIAYLESGMMPKISSSVSAEEEAAKLTEETLGPIGIFPLTDSTSLETVNTAVKNFAKVFVKTGYVKVEVAVDTEKKLPSFEFKMSANEGKNTGENTKENPEVDKVENVEGAPESGKNENVYHTVTWKGRLKVTNYSDETDVAYSTDLTLTVHDNYEDFARQKVLKKMVQYDKDGAIFDVLSIENLDDFKSALTLYSKNRLESFYDAIKLALGTLQQLDQASEYADLYEKLYVPYTEKLNSLRTVCNECGKEIEHDKDNPEPVTQCPHCGSENPRYGELDIRREQIHKLEIELAKKSAEREEIISKLDLETNLGEYYPLFSSYRRESVYSNEHYFSDGLTNEEIIAKAKEFVNAAKEELYKSSEQQVSISSSLYNLLLLPEFAPLIDNFETGNWIRIRVDGILYTLRLLSFEIDFDNTQTLNVEFANVSRNHDLTDEIKDILDSAKSMGQTYGYVAKQAEKGRNAQEHIQDWVQNGLNTELVQLQNGMHREITCDKQGLLCRAYDDISGTYDAKQLKITNNCIVYTDNNWKSVRQAIGDHRYGTYDESGNRWVKISGYGLTSDFVQSGQVSGATIIGGKIFSMNYSNGGTIGTDGKKMEIGGSYINLDTGEFSFGGDSLYYRNGEFVINQKAIGDSLKNVGIMNDQLHIMANKIEGTLDNDININNTFVVDEDGHVEKITLDENVKIPWKTITLDENDKIPWKHISDTPTIPSDTEIKDTAKTAIDETVTSEYISGLDHLQLNPASIDTDELYCDRLYVLNQETKSHEAGVTGTYTIGDKSLRIINGIIVEIQ